MRRGLPGKGLGLARVDSGNSEKLFALERTVAPCTACQLGRWVVLQQAACVQPRAELSNEQTAGLEQQPPMQGAMSEVQNCNDLQVIESCVELGPARMAVKASTAAAQACDSIPDRSTRVAQAVPSPEVIALLRAAAESQCDHLRKVHILMPPAAAPAEKGQPTASLFAAAKQHMDLQMTFLEPEVGIDADEPHLAYVKPGQLVDSTVVVRPEATAVSSQQMPPSGGTVSSTSPHSSVVNVRLKPRPVSR